MFPKLLTLPAFDLFGRHIAAMTLHTYGVLLALAFVAGLWVAGRQARKAGLDAARVTDMAVYVLIAGLVGAKALLVVVEWDYYVRHPGELLSILQSGGVFYGGLLAALPVAWWYARKHSLPGWRTADVLVPAVVLGQAIGRLGCFCAGCCYGKAADVPWAVTFHDPYASRTVGTPLDTPLHPTELYESIACFLIFFVLVRLSRRKRFDGQVTLAYMFLYAVARFVIEFYRGDAVRGTVFGWLSTSQFIALLMVFAAALLLPYVSKKNRLEPPPGTPAAPTPAPA
jgi:phosphatidylglycerol:prolipoprotein diacylglycerol transferase